MENLLGKMQELLSDPETMQQVSELAEMLKADSNHNSNQNPENSRNSQDMPNLNNSNFLNPDLLMKAGELLKQNSEPDKNTALLLALRPHLREQRQHKVDNAVKLLQLWNIFKNLQQTGILQNFLS